MSSRRPRPLRAALASLLAAAALTGCSGSDGDPAPPAAAAPTDVVQALGRALDARARVVRRADGDAFARLVGGGPAFRERQETWFGNVTQLPVAQLSYRADPGSLVREGDAYRVTVTESLQLDGYDAAPVTREARYRFAPTPRHPRRFRLTAATESDPQPWDTGPVEVREGDGVLGVFDPESVDQAPALIASVESGIATVSAEVPYDWPGTVVVYALTDPAFLDGLEDVPGDDPGDLDAVAFPAGEGTRFVLNPRMVADPGPDRDRLVRHELTHVAVGTRDDEAPVWLSEGLAEYVSVRPLAPEDRRIPEAAVAAAEAGVDDLPDDATFNDEDSDAHYGLAWWAVEYLADAYGEDAPWRLLDAMSGSGADPDTVLHDQFGTSTRELARQADRLIVSLYEAVG
ncbi:hypothetical protein [Nocardioides sp. T2.26MG-1]|uniref:hypothetical protein n=1 Tax=Nocardioides sp. T2.26MG-1 TaxID=3041166 RepID=UPI00247783BD|nr:hypothetical protein [Nocardioides sp. T2.26MG-1]CAI9413494.1 hypothetical protein HIDPHFAB_02035 [Nocardioides sp. T2.26MG-1]